MQRDEPRPRHAKNQMIEPLAHRKLVWLRAVERDERSLRDQPVVSPMRDRGLPGLEIN